MRLTVSFTNALWSPLNACDAYGVPAFPQKSQACMQRSTLCLLSWPLADTHTHMQSHTRTNLFWHNGAKYNIYEQLLTSVERSGRDGARVWHESHMKLIWGMPCQPVGSSLQCRIRGNTERKQGSTVDRLSVHSKTNNDSLTSSDFLTLQMVVKLWLPSGFNFIFCYYPDSDLL